MTLHRFEQRDRRETTELTQQLNGIYGPEFVEENDDGAAWLHVLQSKSLLRDCRPPSLSGFSVCSSFVVSKDLTVAKYDVEHSSIAKFLE